MKSAIATLFLLSVIRAVAEGPSLHGQQFLPGKAEVVWAAPTNQLPPALWVYKVGMQAFSPATVSNAILLGQFSSPGKSRSLDGYPYDQPEMLHFSDKEKTRYLNIFPANGWLEYYDSKVRAVGKEAVRGVPTEAEAVALALHHLQRLGIDRSQFAVKPNCELNVFRDVRERTRRLKDGTDQKDILSRGVFLIRRIDGVDFTGLGSDAGFAIHFGNEGRVAAMELVWRNLIPHELCEVLTPEKLLNTIRQGGGVLVNILPSEIRMDKINVTRITPYYLGESGDKRQSLVWPFAALELTASGGNTNFNFKVKCPIIAPDSGK